MVKTQLVSLDIERGREVVEALESAKFKVAAALWVVLPEYEDWRLVISGRPFESPRHVADYGKLHDALSAAGFPLERTPLIMILPTTDPTIKELRRIFGKTKSIEGMRLGGQMIGDRFIEDAYVYKIS
jgi:hypothetical protein